LDLVDVRQESEESEGAHDSFSGFFNSHFSSKAWRYYVWEDYLTQPAVLIPLGLGAAAAIISHWDKTLEKHLRNSLTGTQTLGNVTMYTLIAGSLLSGILFPGDDRNSWDELFTQGEGFGTTALTTWALKESVRRPRPFAGGGQMHSFPSGHTSGAFCAATCIERNSGIWAGIPAYALAALTGYSRIDAARHYPSDVLAGAAIGMLSARIFDALHWGMDGKGGIARPGWDVRVTMEDHRHGMLEVVLGF
jgi:membrane-associated phospholipid phosphatase